MRILSSLTFSLSTVRCLGSALSSFQPKTFVTSVFVNMLAGPLDMKLDLLSPGSYQATIVQDGEDGNYQKNRGTLRVEKRQAGPDNPGSFTFPQHLTRTPA